MDPWGTPHLMVCSEEQVWLIWTHCWGQEKVRVRWSNSLTFSKEQLGRFPFDQKFLKFRVWEQMEQTFSGISFRNFRCTSQGWPKIPENRNNQKIPFHSTILARAQFLRARKSNSTWLPILLLNISVPLVIMRQMTWMFFCTTFSPVPRQTFVSTAKMHISYVQCLKLMW